MSYYQPGTVAVVRHMEEDCRAMRTGTPSNMGWEIVRGDGSKTWASDSSKYVTDIRPLVVFDPEHPSIQFFIKTWQNVTPREKAGVETTVGAARYLADQIEAQTKPPRIPEPTPYGVVEASSSKTPGRVKWVRQGELWWNGSAWTTWDDLIDSVLIRDGVQS